MSLTTPVIRDEDHVFPGEDWFFYWKTSASLWQSKLEQLSANRTLYVPINWSFHSETGDHYDFAQEKPETDLARLARVAADCGREVIFLFPLSPFPFLPNGGVPTFLARHPSLDEQGKMIASIDHAGGLNKIYSFYDTRIYQSYSKLTQAFGQYLSSSGIRARVWGIECGHVGEHGFTSFFNDTSQAFTQGFSQFLQGKREDRRRESSQMFEDGVLSPMEEYLYQKEFVSMIRSIYSDRAKSSLAGHWEGSFKVSLMGSSQNDFFQRINGQDSLSNYAHDILEALSLDTIPSSILVPARLKKSVLGRMLSQLVTSSYVSEIVQDDIFEDEGSSTFRLKRFFDVYDLTEDVDPNSMGWADLGLWDYLQDHFSWAYSDKGSALFKWNETFDENRILFFHGITVDRRLYQEMLKAFMNGNIIILNRSGLDQDILRKFEAFFIENNLSVEKVNFHTSLHHVSLGQGKLLIFEGDKLVDLEASKVTSFWQQLISTFDLKFFSVPYDQDLETLWLSRSADHREMSYEEIRRLSIYNPSSYKKKITLEVPSQFKLLKVVDEHLASFTHSPKEIQLELLPEGSLSFDFGVLP